MVFDFYSLVFSALITNETSNGNVVKSPQFFRAPGTTGLNRVKMGAHSVCMITCHRKKESKFYPQNINR